MNVLLVEDDLEVAEVVISGLREHGYRLSHATDGAAGCRLATEGQWQVIIVDRMLPLLDGLSLVRTLRAADIATPVIFLTTMSGIDDRVDGLEAGGDDYLVKPFSFVELLARVRARSRPPATDQTPATHVFAPDPQ